MATKLFLDTSQMSVLEATLITDVTFKNNSVNLSYHTSQLSHLNANGSLKGVSSKKNLAKVWAR